MEEEENGVSIVMAKKSNKEVIMIWANMYMHLGTIVEEKWFVHLTAWAA